MERARPDDSLFRVADGNGDETPSYLPSPLASGPWNPAHQHGGPVTGLLTREMDRMPSPVPMRLSRITVEMFRGVPLTPLRIETRVLRAGRRIQSVEANLFDEATQVARATGLRIRTDPSMSIVASCEIPDPDMGAPPEDPPPLRRMRGFTEPPGFIKAVDLAREDDFEAGQLANVWVRLRCRLMQDEETAPIERLATLVDFASGTGNPMDYTKYSSINPDLSVHILREPRSDWIGIRGITFRADDGIGLSTATIHDRKGPIATAQASLLLDRR